MRQDKTLAIVLRRTNFGEADRIVNFITPAGKVVGIARGARKQKSKLAGGIEVFALNEVVLMKGKNEMKTIISARMREFFGEIIKDLDPDVTDRHVLIVEDIIDSGRTAQALRKLFAAKNAASVKICSLLDKPERREVEVQADYVGINTPNEFVVGYGLDFRQQYRNLPYIGVLKPEVYQS
mgnify:CR=1 FL=1